MTAIFEARHVHGLRRAMVANATPPSDYSDPLLDELADTDPAEIFGNAGTRRFANAMHNIAMSRQPTLIRPEPTGTVLALGGTVGDYDPEGGFLTIILDACDADEVPPIGAPVQVRCQP